MLLIKQAIVAVSHKLLYKIFFVQVDHPIFVTFSSISFVKVSIKLFLTLLEMCKFVQRWELNYFFGVIEKMLIQFVCSRKYLFKPIFYSEKYHMCRLCYVLFSENVTLRLKM